MLKKKILKIKLKIGLIDKKYVITFDLERTQPNLNAQEPEHEYSVERTSTIGSLGEL